MDPKTAVFSDEKVFEMLPSEGSGAYAILEDAVGKLIGAKAVMMTKQRCFGSAAYSNIGRHDGGTDDLYGRAGPLALLRSARPGSKLTILSGVISAVPGVPTEPKLTTLEKSEAGWSIVDERDLVPHL